MIWRLLRKNISVWQLLGYAVANLIGLVIVLSAVRFYGDVAPSLSDDAGDGGIVSQDYLVVSKPVSLLNTIGGRSTSFSPDEIDDLKAQAWVTGVGEFSSADFNVSAAVDFAGRGLQTFMFMESIPDEFVDSKSDDWRFDPSLGTAQRIPIILSKDYLALYNFGFASSRGLPQISEGMISQIPLMLQLSGNGHSDAYRAHIVGFSSRLNTIAVPDSFMQWANARYSSAPKSQPSRLIVKVNRPGDPHINEYFGSKGYEVAGDKLDNGRAAYFLTLLTSSVAAVGAVISVLALFILMLSIHLLMHKNREKVSDLLMLGYTPAQVSAGYFRLIGIINLAVLVVAIAAMLGLSRLWEVPLSTLSITPSSPLMPVLIGVAIMALITAVNFMDITRAVRRAFR